MASQKPINGHRNVIFQVIWSPRHKYHREKLWRHSAWHFNCRTEHGVALSLAAVGHAEALLLGFFCHNISLRLTQNYICVHGKRIWTDMLADVFCSVRAQFWGLWFTHRFCVGDTQSMHMAETKAVPKYSLKSLCFLLLRRFPTYRFWGWVIQCRWDKISKKNSSVLKFGLIIW